MATINDIPQPDNCSNCDDLATKLCELISLIETIPPCGAGQVPYTDCDRCHPQDELPSFEEALTTIKNILECLIWQYCNLFCERVFECLEADPSRLCTIITPCVSALIANALNSLLIRNCADVVSCLTATPQTNLASTGTFAKACDGSLVVTDIIPSTHIYPVQSLPATIVENPYTNPTWTFGGAGPYGNFAFKTFNIFNFDISAILPAPCAGYKYYAYIVNNWDFAFTDLGVPTGSWVYGYNGMQTFVNGSGGIGAGIPLNAGTFLMSPTGGQWAPTESNNIYYELNYGNNSIDTKLIVNKTESPSGNTAQKTHTFTPQKLQIVIFYGKQH